MKRAIALTALCLFFAACSDDDPTGPQPVAPTMLDEILAQAGMVVPLDEERDDVTTVPREEGDYRYIDETHDAVENLENVTCLGLNDDVIWPGSLVRGDRVYEYVYEPIVVPRTPVTLSISLEGAGFGDGLAEVVTNPTLSTVRQGISNLVGRALESHVSAPAQVDFSYQQVYSASQMSLFLDADISYGAGDISTSFNWEEGSSTNKIMAKYTQVYYSIDMDTPASPSAVLSPDITEAQARAALPAGSRPVYVASVKYGLMAIMCIETSFTMSQMQLALDASYSGIVDVDLGFGYTAAEVMSASSIRIIVYGGSTGGIEELTGFDGFMNIIAASTEFTPQSPGVPLLYKFRHLRDNTLAMISLTSRYTITHPIRIRQGMRITCNRIVCEMSDDDDPFYDAEVDMDTFQIFCNAFNRTGPADPGVQANPVNQPVFLWSTGDPVEMWAGYVFEVGTSTDVIFNTDTYDFNYARLNLAAFANDHDWGSGNENSWGTLDLVGPAMAGAHSVMIYNADFRFRVEMTIVPVAK
jgi:hypothetical protein